MSQTLKNLIKQNLNIADTYENKNDFIDALADGLSKAVQQYLSSNVVVRSGQAVQTRGTSAAQTGTTTSVGRLDAQ